MIRIKIVAKQNKSWYNVIYYFLPTWIAIHTRLERQREREKEINGRYSLYTKYRWNWIPSKISLYFLKIQVQWPAVEFSISRCVTINKSIPGFCYSASIFEPLLNECTRRIVNFLLWPFSIKYTCILLSPIPLWKRSRPVSK